MVGKTKGHEATSFGKKENRFDERGPIYERWPILLNGNVIQGTSLKKLLEDCEDFKNETSIMEFISEKRGVKMISTPKYHCELAGEVIEYAWGFIERRDYTQMLPSMDVPATVATSCFSKPP